MIISDLFWHPMLSSSCLKNTVIQVCPSLCVAGRNNALSPVLSLPQLTHSPSQLNKQKQKKYGQKVEVVFAVLSHNFTLSQRPSALSPSGVSCCCYYPLNDTPSSPPPSLTLNCLNTERLQAALSCYMHLSFSRNIHEPLHLSLWQLKYPMSVFP